MGGRYACAQTLIKRRVPFLSGMSLGKVCHVVQLAMAQHKLLGYLNGGMVPYAHSQSCAKEQSAAKGEVCANSTELPLADWDTARACLRKLLQVAPSNLLSVSNVKRLFRSEFQIELSETRLGHSKMTTLLLDERLRDICHVQLHGHGHAVVQVATSSKDSRPLSGAWADLSEDPLSSENLALDADIPMPHCAYKSDLNIHPHGSTEFREFDVVEVGMVKNTFIHVMASSHSSHLQMTRKRSHSVPKDFGSHCVE